MGILIAFYLLLVAGAISLLLYRQYVRGEAEIISFRNIAVLGFVYFQLWSAMYPLATGDTLRYPIPDLIATGLTYAAMATVFCIIFWIVYQRGWGMPKLASLVPFPRIRPSEPMLWAIACASLPLAVVLKFSVQIPLVGILAAYSANSLAAVSAGIGGWIWARRFFNPFVICMVGVLFLLSCFVAMIGEFGRRPLVGVALCMVWGMYFSAWRYQRMIVWVPRLVVLASIGLVVVTAYSSVRAQRGVTDSVESLWRGITSGSDIAKGGESMIFTDTAPVSMWLISTHPETFEPMPLFTLYYTFLNPVPRQWWPDKPLPLGLRSAKMSGVRNVDKEFSLGPGFLGHAGAEGGWYALVIYAIGGALLLKFFDVVALRDLRNPLIMMPLGSTLGQVLALARGETSLFVFIFVFGTTVTYAGMLLLLWCGQLLGIREDVVSPIEGATDDQDLSDSSVPHGELTDEWSDEHEPYDDDPTHS